MQVDLFAAVAAEEWLDDGAVLLRGFAGEQAPALRDAVDKIVAAAPLRHLTVPGGGVMSVAMTNCGTVGWLSDRRGYRYVTADPDTGRAWPAMPAALSTLAAAAAARAGYPAFVSDACLINRYVPGAKMGLHRDHDEGDLEAPIVSVSLGLPAMFLWGGAARTDKPRRVPIQHGDVVVWGGATRLHFHGVAPVPKGHHAMLGAVRLNLTFRKSR